MLQLLISIFTILSLNSYVITQMTTSSSGDCIAQVSTCQDLLQRVEKLEKEVSLLRKSNIQSEADVNTKGCVVNLRSYSEENIDSERYGYMNTSGDLIFNSTYSGPNYYRGVVIHALDPWNCMGYGSLHNFDTNLSTDESDFLVRFLKGTQNGTILLGVSLDDPYSSLQPALSFLLSAGIDVGDVGYRGMFAFVLQTGFPNKTVVEKAKTRPWTILLSVEIRTGIDVKDTEILRLP